MAESHTFPAASHEPFCGGVVVVDRRIVAGQTPGGPGVAAEDVRWLLANAPDEVVVLRPGAGRYVTPLGPARAPEPATTLASVV